jgi:hypothetical protein
MILRLCLLSRKFTSFAMQNGSWESPLKDDRFISEMAIRCSLRTVVAWYCRTRDGVFNDRFPALNEEALVCALVKVAVSDLSRNFVMLWLTLISDLEQGISQCIHGN